MTLDDPERLNPLSAALTVQLHDELTALAREPEVRAIVLTGRDPAFSAGGDLRLMAEAGQEMLASAAGATDVWRWIRGQFGGIARLITRTDKAFIAAVNGSAAGVGLAFALACDVLLLSERARIVPAFGRIGLVPEVGNSWALTRRLGYQRAFGLFASGRHLTGAEAFELGLGNELVEHEQLLGSGGGVVRAGRAVAGARPRDEQAPASPSRRHDVGAGDRDGGVLRADVLHDRGAPGSSPRAARDRDYRHPAGLSGPSIPNTAIRWPLARRA